jgi:organic hydroperoxide reductase OsmC/OhrA
MKPYPHTYSVSARGSTVANCFILPFRGVSRAASFGWEQLEFQVDGSLERVTRVTQFSKFTTRATLSVKAGADHAKAQELMQRADKACLVANSLRGERHLEIRMIEMTP